MQGLREVMTTTWGRPLAPSEEWERLRRRLLAFAGLWTLLGGLVAALGFGAFVLDATVALLVLVGAAGSLLALSLARCRNRLRSATRRIAPAARELGARAVALELPRRLKLGGSRARGASRQALAALAAGGATARAAGLAGAAAGSRRARGALARIEPHRIDLDTAARRSAGTLQELGESTRTAASRLSARASSAATRQRQATRLNTQGAQLRREGRHERAVERHRAALAIVRDLGDRRTEALTLNNLALAVVHTDGLEDSVRYFEQALAVLRELGDVEHEGRVIANLGFVHRSHGHGEEADGLLHAALEKLPADSSAYRRVEEQLLRAS